LAADHGVDALGLRVEQVEADLAQARRGVDLELEAVVGPHPGVGGGDVGAAAVGHAAAGGLAVHVGVHGDASVGGGIDGPAADADPARPGPARVEGAVGRTALDGAAAARRVRAAALVDGVHAHVLGAVLDRELGIEAVVVPVAGEGGADIGTRAVGD